MWKMYQTKEYITNIVSNLDIQRPPYITLHHDPVLNAIKKIWKRPKYNRNKKQVPSDVAFTFPFRKMTLNEIIKIINEIMNFDELKSTQSNDIPTEVVKKTLTYLLLLLLKTLTKWPKTLFSKIHLNMQVLSQYIKKIPGVKRKITGR